MVGSDIDSAKLFRANTFEQVTCELPYRTSFIEKGICIQVLESIQDGR